MKLGVALFVYKRPWHTKQVIDALKNNSVLPNMIYVFQDNIKNKADIDEWHKVNDLVNGIDWCEKEVIISDNNLGLAKSIMYGVNYVLERCEAIVVLEDDCVTHPQFMDFMTKGLNKYQKNELVYSVSGYSIPLKVNMEDDSVYYTGRISSWGWGTWRDRWKAFKPDYNVLERIRGDYECAEGLSTWGEDLVEMLARRLAGQNDSWAVFWALHVIEKKGYNVVPCESLVDNIGFDGSGTHSGNNKVVFKMQEGMRQFKFADEPFYRDDIKKAYSDYYHRIPRDVVERYYRRFWSKCCLCVLNNIDIVEKLLKENIKDISIWGCNEITDFLIDIIAEKINIKNIIQTKESINKDYKGISLVTAANMDKDVDAIVVIPYYDMNNIEMICKELNYVGKIVPISELVEMA